MGMRPHVIRQGDHVTKLAHATALPGSDERMPPFVRLRFKISGSGRPRLLRLRAYRPCSAGLELLFIARESGAEQLRRARATARSLVMHGMGCPRTATHHHGQPAGALTTAQ